MIASAIHGKSQPFFLMAEKSINKLCMLARHDGNEQGSIDSYNIRAKITRGAQARSHELFIGDSVLYITANLASALIQFRSRHRYRTLWADAICINQADDVEKGAQIPIMWRIFANALRVRVWLGSDDTKAAANVLNLGWWKPEMGVLTSETKDSISHFFGQPWFGRRWVIQEVVLNTDVIFYCGSAKMSWPGLNSIFRRIPDPTWQHNKQEKTRDMLMQVADLWLKLCYSTRSLVRTGLWDLLDSLAHTDCENNKDRIYAFVGLADDVSFDGLDLVSLLATNDGISRPQNIATSPVYSLASDYTRSDSELFSSVTLPRLQASQLLYCTLAFAGAHRPLTGTRKYASWIPDFELPGLWEADPIHDRTYLGPSNVSEALDGSLNLQIAVHAWKYPDGSDTSKWVPNTVNNLSPVVINANSALGSLQDLQRLHAWLNSLPTTSGRTTEKYVEATISGIMSQLSFRSTEDEQKAWSEAHKWLFGGLSTEQLEEKSDLPWAESLSPLFAALAGRRFFIGRAVSYRHNSSREWHISSFIGFGPSDLVIGDEFIPSSACGKALFMRPVQGGYMLLGGGYARLPSGVEAPPRQERTFYIL